MQFQQISQHRIIVYHFLFYRPDKKTYRCPFAGCNKYQYMKNESCYREFSWKSNLNNHMQIHDPNRSKSFICQYCKKGFYDAQHLKQHQWIHNRNPEVLTISIRLIMIRVFDVLILVVIENIQVKVGYNYIFKHIIRMRRNLFVSMKVVIKLLLDIMI